MKKALLILLSLFLLTSCHEVITTDKPDIDDEPIIPVEPDPIAKKEIAAAEDYSSRTIKKVNFSDYDGIYSNVKFGVTRNADTIIYFDNDHYVKTNIYGYELLCDIDGRVIDKNTNVELLPNTYVISAHGNKRDILKNIDIGEYVIYSNNSIYLYKDLKLEEDSSLYFLYYLIIGELNLVEDIKEYNNYVDLLNPIVLKLNSIYNKEENDYLTIRDDLENLYSLMKKDNQQADYQKEYNNYDVTKLGYFDTILNESSYSFIYQYDGTIYNGGFRQADKIHLYNQENYRDRNPYGYEIAVDKDGYIVEKDVLVELPVDGYILSGHSSTKTILVENTSIGDKVELGSDYFKIYRSSLKTIVNSYKKVRNEYYDYLIYEYNNHKLHDYKYIYDNLIKLDNLIVSLNDDISLFNIEYNNKQINEIEITFAYLYASLVNNIDTVRGLCYYPFSSNCPDKSYDDIVKLMDEFEEMGLNLISIKPFYSDYILYDSECFIKYPELDNMDFGEYGHDYLKCFIEEAHQRDIKVEAFTQTFMFDTKIKYDNLDELYQMDINGEKSKGGVYYYDICNDKLQNILIDFYKEIVTLYDFDSVEYDIIRYSNSNLPNYLDYDIIPSNVVIEDPGWTKYSINKFKKLYNIDINVDLKELIYNDKNVRRSWLEYKENELNKFVETATLEMKKIRNDIVVSAAVFADTSMVKKFYLQDYLYWLENKMIDVAEPMCYTSSSNELINYKNKYDIILNGYEYLFYLSPLYATAPSYETFKQIYLTNEVGYMMFANNLYVGVNWFSNGMKIINNTGE